VTVLTPSQAQQARREAADDLYFALADLVDAVLNDVDKERRIRVAERALAKARGDQVQS
jgi:hypothetical protein